MSGKEGADAKGGGVWVEPGVFRVFSCGPCSSDVAALFFCAVSSDSVVYNDADVPFVLVFWGGVKPLGYVHVLVP